MNTRNLAASLGDRGDVIGIDSSPSILKEATRRAHKLGVAPSFARADAENLPFADASFEGTVCGGSLNEFGDPARTLREKRRVLKPGGRVAIMGILEARSTRGKRLQRFLSVSGVRFFEPDEVMSLLDHAGLEPDPLKTHGAVFFAGATRR
jgi:ubiquinone/menaquinone biosynthesis C-methylase UbiE